MNHKYNLNQGSDVIYLKSSKKKHHGVIRNILIFERDFVI